CRELVLPLSSSQDSTALSGCRGARPSSWRARKAATMSATPLFMSKMPGPKARRASTRNGRLASVPCGQTVSTWPSSRTGGTLPGGSGGAPFVGDVAIQGDRVVAVVAASENPARASEPAHANTRGAHGKGEIDAHGQAVAPGFVNMLSWATESLLVDGRSQGDIRQGVTLEVFGEGWSMGPLNDDMKKESQDQQGDVTYDV